MFPTLKSSLFPQWRSLGGNLIFICKLSPIGDNFCIRDWGICLLLHSTLGFHLVHISDMHAVYWSRWSRRSFFLVSFIPLALTLFLLPLLQGSLSHEGRNLVETSCLGLNIQRHLVLCVMSGCGSLYSLLLQEEASLIKVQQDTALWVLQQNAFESHFMVIF